MILETKISKQEELVKTLEYQLNNARVQLAELNKVDFDIEETIKKLKALIEQNPEYKEVVSENFKVEKVEIVDNEYTPEELDAYESLYGEPPRKKTKPSEPKPSLNELKAEILKKTTKEELEAFKASIGEEKTEKIWNNSSIVEKNYLRCITQSEINKKNPAILGYRIQYTAPSTKTKYDSIYLGYYLYGELLENENQRVIFANGKAIVCSKDDIKVLRKQTPLSIEERLNLERIISEPVIRNEQPTAEEMANNNFTGLTILKSENNSNKPNKANPNAVENIINQLSILILLMNLTKEIDSRFIFANIAIHSEFFHSDQSSVLYPHFKLIIKSIIEA